MSRTLHRGCLLAVLWLAACSQNPTAPSHTTPLADSASSGVLSSWSSQSNGIAVADWACLTRGVGCPLRAELDMLPAEDVPGAPSNLAFQTSGSTIVLTWSAPAGGGATATYVLEAGSAAGQTNIASFNTGSAATTLTVTTVPNGTYFVRVRARNADGTSGPSNEVTIVLGGGGCETPSAPAGFTASATGNTVTLAWGSVAGANSFVIEAGSTPGASNIITFDTGSTATSFSGSAPNGTYYLRVRVRTACGTSAPSNEAALTVGGAPPQPGNLSGLWEGTLTIREFGTVTPRPIQIDFTQSGTRLTGTARGRLATFDLTETGSNPASFQGTLNIPGNTGCEVMPGSLTAPTATRLTGSFICADGRSNEFDLTKAQ